MEERIELELLKDLENLLPPKFNLLPDVIYYDKSFNELCCFKSNYNELKHYISLSNPNQSESRKAESSKQIEYLKRVLPYLEKDSIVFFDLEKSKEYLLKQQAYI